MSAIGPGDWVELIGPKGVTSPVCPEFVGGGLYCVEELVWTASCRVCGSKEHAGLHIVGKPRTKHGWAGCIWRPIYRPKSELIEILKQPAPDAVHELEDA